MAQGRRRSTAGGLYFNRVRRPSTVTVPSKKRSTARGPWSRRSAISRPPSSRPTIEPRVAGRGTELRELTASRRPRPVAFLSTYPQSTDQRSSILSGELLSHPRGALHYESTGGKSPIIPKNHLAAPRNAYVAVAAFPGDIVSAAGESRKERRHHGLAGIFSQDVANAIPPAVQPRQHLLRYTCRIIGVVVYVLSMTKEPMPRALLRSDGRKLGAG